MIPQLVDRLAKQAGGTPPPPAAKAAAAARVLTADPFDLVLHMEQVWDAARPWGPLPNPQPAGPARQQLFGINDFDTVVPGLGVRAWDHLAYSYVLENTRVVQIFRRVVREYRSGEGLGIPSVATQRWLDTTETLLFGAPNPIPLWLSTSAVRGDPEAVRRNAYWRMFGLDLAFGSDDNRPPVYDKATAANKTFVSLFEELLYELWQAMTNLRNTAGVNASDDDRIFRIAEQLKFVLRSRRQNAMLSREELISATVLGWCELTLLLDSPVVVDLRADATSAGDRLRLIGERVGLAPHSKASSLLSMASEISILLRAIEEGYVSAPEFSWVLYRNDVPSTTTPNPVPGGTPFGPESRRVITEWSAATGRDLKVRAKPAQVTTGATNGRQPVGTR
jgi:hypothetical protein